LVVYPNINPAGQKLSNVVDNKYRVEAIGNVIRTWINDIPVACLIDDVTDKGFIALQVHSIGKRPSASQQIRWRNIRIQTGADIHPHPADNTPVVNLTLNNLSEQEKSQRSN
jgi:hypothetical protein